MIVETTGGLAPHSRRHCGYLHGRSKGNGAVDRTRYGQGRGDGYGDRGGGGNVFSSPIMEGQRWRVQSTKIPR